MIPSQTIPDTIFALSSGRGRSGVAVVRMSGPQSRTALQRLAGVIPEKREATLVWLKGPTGDIIDQALALFFEGPGSATGEDMAEFHVHGSITVIERVLQELAHIDGCRMAKPGEFTRRAFEKGKLDLVEVEGLADLVSSETEAQRKLAMKQFMGEASAVYESWRARLVDAQATIEAAIDFPDEHGVSEQAEKALRGRISALRFELSEAAKKAETASAVRRGLSVVIAGAPNSGKSSLVNALVGREMSIVSPVAGTTRDVVSERLVIEGVPVRIADTAGLRESTSDEIERMGMARTAAEISGADLLVWLRSVGDDAGAEPPRKPDIDVRSKCDLAANDPSRSRNDFLDVSARTEEGLGAFRDALGKLVQERLSQAQDGTMVRARHADAVRKAIGHLDAALAEPVTKLEIIAENMRKAGLALAGITGAVGAEDWLGRIYAEFCIGK
jgi:tRNA modification GTPase